jgi:hypothetical protein
MGSWNPKEEEIQEIFDKKELRIDKSWQKPVPAAAVRQEGQRSSS